MDYEKKYKEALELARVAAFNGHQSLMEGIFPELAESEDEKTRKEIIYHIKNCDDTIDEETEKRMIAWLENIPYTIDHEKREGFHLGYKAGLEKQGEPSDKIHYWTEEEIEPIISDYLRGAEHYGGMIGRLRCLKPKSLEKQGDSPIKWNKNTEGNKPKVNHSVLMKTTHGIAEGEWKGEYWEQYRWAGIVRDSDVLSWMELSDLEKQGEQKQKQYDIDVLEKHITKDSISELAHTVIVRNGWEIVDAKEQKPAWSEKDECYMSECIGAIATKDGWSFEEKRKTKHWLESLKQTIGWKPSDEQITVLELASKYERVFTPKQIDILIDLKEQLKKLRGE